MKHEQHVQNVEQVELSTITTCNNNNYLHTSIYKFSAFQMSIVSFLFQQFYNILEHQGTMRPSY